MSVLTFPTGTYHFNDHPLFDFQLNRVVMWNHGDPAEIQARGGEITDFPSWERVLKELSAQAEAREDWAAAAGYLRMAEFFMAPDTPECHAAYDRAREIFYTHFTYLFAEQGGPIHREEVPYHRALPVDEKPPASPGDIYSVPLFFHWRRGKPWSSMMPAVLSLTGMGSSPLQ